MINNTRICFLIAILSVFLMSVSTAYSQDISIGDVTAADGTTITVPLIINNAPNYVDVFALNVSFCSDNLTFTGCDFTGSLVDNFFTRNCDFIDVVGDTQDQILISGYEDDIGAGLDQGTSGTLVNLTFEANCTPGETCDFILSDLLNHFSGWTPGNGSFQCACVPSGPEVCDGVDNDCDPNTPDGADETWLGDPCDGADSDLCNEGAFQCVAGAMTCSDNTGDTLEICDGVDNDCNPATADGADETWLGSACDSDADTDLCEDDTYQCTSGTQTCSDINGSILDLCDGADNDCNPATADGADETWLGDPCDGADSDLCNEGDFQCVAGAMTCSDNTGDTLEICNGQDDDCNPATADGADETWLGSACDSDADTDLCEDDTYQCISGTQTCSDINGSILDLCDGADNDCNPATADGADETWLGDPCDGTDSDLCNEGTFQCVGSAMSCTDNTDDTLEICNGQDDDCNPATADGADETWLGSACDSDADTDLCEDDTYQCISGTQTCSDINGSILDLCDGADNDCNPATADGADETWLGDPCDGADSDLCNEGTFQCVGSAMSCTDNTDDTLEICNGQDDDCDGKTDEDASGNPLTQACGSDVGECVSGTQTCASGAWGICEGEVGPAVESPEAGTCADGKDNDCDGLTDDNDSDCLCDPGSQRDCDSGLPGVCADGSQTCNQTGHWDTCVANINPGEQADVCDGLDNDCDGTPDEDFPTLNNPCDGADTDLCEEGTVVCNQDKTGVECSDDPNENDLDLCNGQDDDCNPATEDGADETWLGSACDSDDTDLCEDDSYQCVSGTQTCSDINGSILDLCDGADNDCNPATDDGADEEWLNDPCDGADSDLCNEGIFQCTAGAQSCTDNTDDTVELCNGLDDDCNGLVPVDEFDADGDGVRGCAGDCNDADAAVNPDASEVCDGLDNNCNDQIDEGEGVKNTYYSDSDRDSYGNPDTPTEACHPSVGMVSDNTDCDDTNIAVYPGAPEVCGDEVVNDCNSEAGSEEAAGCDFSGTCTDGETRACNTGGLGICAAGTQGCIDGVWDECLADNQLVDEICNNRLDDNCDGLVDNCNTEFKTFVDLSINPILVCFQANQTLDGDPVVNLIKGNGLVSGLYNPCPNSSLPVYCAYFTPGSGGLDIVPPDGLGDVVVSIEEGTPVGSVPGSAYARFQLETEFESTSSFCLSQTSSGEFIDFLHQAGCDSEEDLTEAYAEVSFEKASLLGLQDDCSADQSAITEVDRSFFAGVIGNTLVTSVVDVSLPDGVTLDGGVVTITLSFELPAGWTRQEFKDNLKIKHSSDGGLTWTSADISNVVVHWDTMTITFDTASLSMFAGSSKQSAASNTSADDTELKGRGCSVIDQKMPTGNAVANTLVFLLPLIVFGIRRKRGKKIK